MKTNRFRYFLDEGMKNVRRNRSMSVASVVTSFATLFMLGIFLALTLNVNSFIGQIARDCQIQAFITEGSDAAQYDAVGQAILQIDGVASIEKYSKEQIFAEMKEKLTAENGESILTGFENDNPYRDSYKVSLTDLSKSAAVTAAMEALPGVANVTAFQETTQMVQNLGNGFRNGSLIAVVVLGVIAAFIISNSIGLSVFSRRKEIHIMKYIGATNWFVRWPFLVEGIIVGIYGAIIAFVVMWGAYWGLLRASGGKLFNTLELVPFGEMALVLAGSFLAAGALIGFIGSLLAIRKHLKV